MKILLGISGGIAAYKSAELVRLYQQQGWRVQVVMTRSAREFIAPLTFGALTREKVLTDLFPSADVEGKPESAGGSIEHIAVAQSADLMVVAPATANTLARMAHGLADDYLSTLFLACPAPVLVAPAMNSEMWKNAATQSNLALLRGRGVNLVDPDEGYLACGMVGAGRMAEPASILQATLNLQRPRDLSGETVLITAGPTREAIDPVRYLSNRSSGRMGYALAAAAAQRGARVILISGPVDASLPLPAGVEAIPVITAAEMEAAALQAFDQCTIAILAAAVADYRPAEASAQKLKKSGGPAQLALEPTPDILAALGKRKGNRRLIGFAAETDPEQGLAYARRKLEAKHADLIVYNDVSRGDIGFESAFNAITLVAHAGDQPLARAPKADIAHGILDAVLRLVPASAHAHR